MKLKTALLGAVAAFAMAPAAFAERGTDGEVKLTFPQAVSILNPYLTDGTKDVLAAGFVIELQHHLLPDDDWLDCSLARDGIPLG